MESKVQSRFKKAIRIFLNVLFYTVIVLLLVFSIANIKVKKENNIANIFGMGMLSVQSDSMHGTFDTGDMLFVHMLDEQSQKEIEVDDIVTYFDLTIHEFITHRVVEVNSVEGYVVTQADYNYINHNSVTEPDQPVNMKDVIAVYSGSKINGFGTSLDYLQSPIGFALCIVLPVVIFLIFEGIILARNVMAVNKHKLEEKYATDKEIAKRDLEVEKERMRAEILAELKSQKQD